MADPQPFAPNQVVGAAQLNAAFDAKAGKDELPALVDNLVATGLSGAVGTAVDTAVQAALPAVVNPAAAAAAQQAVAEYLTNAGAGLTVGPTAERPEAPTRPVLHLNTDTSPPVLEVWVPGTGWRPVTGIPAEVVDEIVANALTLEDGSYLALEDGAPLVADLTDAPAAESGSNAGGG